MWRWFAMAASALILAFVVQQLLPRGASSRVTRGVLPGAIILFGAACTFAFVHVGVGWIRLVLMAIGFGIPSASVPTSVTALSQMAPAYHLGAVLGGYIAFTSLSGVIAPYLTGRLVGAAGAVPLAGYTTILTITGAILVVGGLTALFLIRPERDSKRLEALA